MGIYGSPDLTQKEELKKGMIYCKTCGKEIAKNAKSCPNCGAKASSPIYKKWWFWLILVIIIAAASSEPSPSTVTNNGNVSGEKQNQVQNQTPVQKQEKFTLESHNGAYDDAGFAFYVEGTIKNNTNKTYSYVQVTFNTYDKDGAQLGTAIDNINNLEANGIWKYKAMALTSSDEIASYKLVEITGF